MSFLHVSAINTSEKSRRPPQRYSGSEKKTIRMASLQGAPDYVYVLTSEGYILGKGFLAHYTGVRVGATPVAGISMMSREAFKKNTSLRARGPSDLKVQQLLKAVDHAVLEGWYPIDAIFVGYLLLPGEEKRIWASVRLTESGAREINLSQKPSAKNEERQVMVFC